MDNKELRGNTLVVYVYLVKENRPVGTREVMRGGNLSSPSVAFRHLQKLELMELIEKNESGNYVVCQKKSVHGYVWVGRNLVPRQMFYFFFFIGAFITEIGIILSYLNINRGIEISFLFLTGITAVSMILFFIEGTSSRRKLKN